MYHELVIFTVVLFVTLNLTNGLKYVCNIYVLAFNDKSA